MKALSKIFLKKKEVKVVQARPIITLKDFFKELSPDEDIKITKEMLFAANLIIGHQKYLSLNDDIGKNEKDKIERVGFRSLSDISYCFSDSLPAGINIKKTSEAIKKLVDLQPHYAQAILFERIYQDLPITVEKIKFVKAFLVRIFREVEVFDNYQNLAEFFKENTNFMKSFGEALGLVSKIDGFQNKDISLKDLLDMKDNYSLLSNPINWAFNHGRNIEEKTAIHWICDNYDSLNNNYLNRFVGNCLDQFVYPTEEFKEFVEIASKDKNLTDKICISLLKKESTVLVGLYIDVLLNKDVDIRKITDTDGVIKPASEMVIKGSDLEKWLRIKEKQITEKENSLYSYVEKKAKSFVNLVSETIIGNDRGGR